MNMCIYRHFDPHHTDRRYPTVDKLCVSCGAVADWPQQLMTHIFLVPCHFKPRVGLLEENNQLFKASANLYMHLNT